MKLDRGQAITEVLSSLDVDDLRGGELSMRAGLQVVDGELQNSEIQRRCLLSLWDKASAFQNHSILPNAAVMLVAAAARAIPALNGAR